MREGKGSKGAPSGGRSATGASRKLSTHSSADSARDDIDMTKRVLVVEDEPDLRVSTVEVLKLEGYTAEGAADGAEALEVLQEGFDADLILLDLMMPEMDGWEFRRRQLEEESISEIPVVLFTSANTADRDGEDLEAREVLKKPVAIDDLIDTVDAIVG